MGDRLVLLSTLILLIASPLSRADKVSDLAKENAELRSRVDKLEGELQEIKKLLLANAGQKEQKQPQKAAPQQRETLKMSDEQLKELAELVKSQMPNDKKPVLAGLDIELYGYIKADASYDTSRTTTGNYVVWVDNDQSRGKDDEYNMTANQTRLGMLIRGPQDGPVNTSGRVEIDFYGNGAENKAKMQMRHAYLKLDWPEDRFSIIAGQTWDVISPLNPSTLNYSVLWDSGNIGYRRPQIRLTKIWGVGKNADLKLEGAITRTIADDELSTVAAQKAGEDSGLPTFQGRASLTFPWLDAGPTTIGFSGHWGQEEYDRTTATATSEKFDTWSINLDFTQPVNQWLSVKGELFSGENLDTFFGGIGQGVRNTTSGGITTYHETIGSKGGWIAASLGPWDKWRFNIGAGVDDVKTSDVEAGQRILNRSIFSNVIYKINKNTEIGFELSQWRTEYKGAGDAEDIRAQTSFIYKF